MRRQFIVFIAIVQAILFSVHFLAYESVAFFLLGGHPLIAYYASIAFFLLSCTFVPAIILSNSRDNRAVRLLYKIASLWLGTIYFWLFASVIAWLAYDVSTLFSPMPPLEPFAGMIYGAGLIALIASYITARTVSMKKYEVAIKNLPEAWKGRTAVWASDLHIGHMRGWRHAKRVTDAINAAKPDIVFSGGDLFDGVKDDYKKAIAPCKDIQAMLGTYFIFGNHEEFSKSEGFRDAVISTGMKILKDEKAIVEGMQIVGVDYHTSHDAKQFAEILAKLVDQKLPSIVLKHEPNNVDVAEKAGVSLQISGHTHRAQLWPLNYLARTLYKGFDYGLKRSGELQQLTSSGAGTFGPPYRVGSRTEIVAITFV